MELLWPEPARFVPAFDRLKQVRRWAGLYAVNTLDSNAILGEWPELLSVWSRASVFPPLDFLYPRIYNVSKGCRFPS